MIEKNTDDKKITIEVTADDFSNEEFAKNRTDLWHSDDNSLKENGFKENNTNKNFDGDSESSDYMRWRKCGDMRDQHAKDSHGEVMGRRDKSYACPRAKYESDNLNGRNSDACDNDAAGYNQDSLKRKNSDNDRSHDKDGSEKQSILPFPLPEAHIKMVFAELDFYGISEKNRVIGQIEEAIRDSGTPKELYENLCLKMCDYFEQNTKKFVGKLLLYKRKHCRNGSECVRKATCVFIHPEETSQGVESCLVETDQSVKRKKVDENDEIVLNNVPEHYSQVKIIEEYCEKFGPVKNVRQLKPGKYLIKFVDPTSASNLLYSNELVFDDRKITKFFNLFKRDTGVHDATDSVLNLLSENDVLIDKLYQRGEIQIASKMRRLMTKLRDEILKKQG